MTISLADLIADTRIHLADAQCSQSAAFSDDDLTLYINEALVTLWPLLPDDVLRSYYDVETTDIKNGTAEYDLPDDYYIEVEVLYSGIPCRKCRYSDIPIWNNNEYLKPKANSPAYYIHGTKVGLIPTPSADEDDGLDFYYLKAAPTLTTGASVTLDASYSPIITQLAAGKAVTLKESVAEGKALIESARSDLAVLTGKEKQEETE